MARTNTIKAVAILGLIGLLVCAGTAIAAFPGSNGRIAFAQGSCLWTMKPDGSDRRVLTGGGDIGLTGGVAEPRWSPDGERLVFMSYANGNYDIYVLGVDDGEPTRLTSDPHNETSPTWSPDGTEIAFVGEQAGQADIYLIDATGGTPSRVTDTPARERFLSWSPDGGRIAFSTRSGGGDETLRAIDVEGGGEQILATGDPYAQQADWSPDGEKIAFVGGHEGEYASTWVVDADGSDAHLVRHDAGGPSWSPDGARIAFTGPYGGGQKYVGTMAADGSDVVSLATGAYETAWGSRQAPPAHSSNGGDVNCDGAVRIAVLGDSYISAEGAADDGQPYRPGTDVDNPFDKGSVNLCHRSERSWALQLARRLARPGAPVIDFATDGEPSTAVAGDTIAFLACSGAVTDNVDGVRTRATAGEPDAVQYTERVTQLDRLAELEPETIDIVLLSTGGNDAGFGDVIKDCLFTRCLALNGWRERYLGRLPKLRERIIEVISNVRSVTSNAELYRMDYPDPLRPLPDDCGSLGATGLAGVIAAFADGGMKIDASERRWLSETFQEELNGMFDAGSLLAGAHVINVVDAFRDHAVCSPQPYVHGLKAGRSGSLPVGNESFHPTPAGQDRLLQVALDQYPLDGFGLRPNPAAISLVPDRDIDYLSVAVVGDDPDTDVFTASSQAHVIIKDGPPNTVIVVPTFSLGSAGGRGMTDAEGRADIAVRLGPSIAPGLHHAELWTEGGQRLAALPLLVDVGPTCVGSPDADGDHLTDLCDLDPTDGPLADADGDGLPNGADGCPLQVGSGTADEDEDGESDECDPDRGADLFATGLRGPSLPPVAVAPGAPLQLTANSGESPVTIAWQPPASDGGSPLTGYAVSVPGRSDISIELGPNASSALLPGLEPGTTVRTIVRARNAVGLGAVALSEPIAVPQPVPTSGGDGEGRGVAGSAPSAPTAFGGCAETGPCRGGVAFASAGDALADLIAAGCRPRRIGALLARRHCAFPFNAPEAGTLKAQLRFVAGQRHRQGKRTPLLVAAGVRRVPRAGRTKVVVRLGARGVRLLHAARKRVELQVKAQFSPRGGGVFRRTGSAFFPR